MTNDSDILRPAATGWKADLGAFAMAHAETGLSILRKVWPIAHFGNTYIVTRYDNVREIFLNDAAFTVPYAANLDLIMGGEKFFLGMGDTPEYRRDTAAMRAVVLDSDLAHLADEAARRADALLDAAAGRIEVVDFTRQVTFGVLCPYFGMTPPSDGNLQVWATRLFEFQFTYSGNDAPLLADATRMAPLLRAHVDSLIAARIDAGRGDSADAGRGAGAGADDVLGRALTHHASGAEGFDPVKIRSALIGFLVGGLPQPPMVLPFALEQLLRRPPQLNEATAAARAGDTPTVANYLFEALRFDPLAPGLQRKAVAKTLVAPGMWYETIIPAGASVVVAFASAMRDPRRVADPEVFNPKRPATDYLHFGYGLHRCFGEHINRAVLPATLQRLLRRDVRRARGAAGNLKKRGIFADTLWVEF
jgi:cytochrome P450